MSDLKRYKLYFNIVDMDYKSYVGTITKDINCLSEIEPLIKGLNWTGESYSIDSLYDRETEKFYFGSYKVRCLMK